MAEETEDTGAPKTPKGSVVINEERCKGCTFCVEFCPKGALAMSRRLNRRGYRLPELAAPDQCIGCDMCGTYCPDFAIKGYRLKKRGDKDV